MGLKVVEYYFEGKDILELLEDRNKEGDSRAFLQDGLFCEYAYIYNQDNDTIEVYRGFFKEKQNLQLDMEQEKATQDGDIDKANAIKTLKQIEKETGTGTSIKGKLKKVVEGRDTYFCHLILIVDKKIHTLKQVKKAFITYDKWENEEGDVEGNKSVYPERTIIPLIYNKELVGIA